MNQQCMGGLLSTRCSLSGWPEGVPSSSHGRREEGSGLDNTDRGLACGPFSLALDQLGCDTATGCTPAKYERLPALCVVEVGFACVVLGVAQAPLLRVRAGPGHRKNLAGAALWVSSGP